MSFLVAFLLAIAKISGGTYAAWKLYRIIRRFVRRKLGAKK